MFFSLTKIFKPKQKRIYILLGPSGSGKTTLGKELIKMGIPEVISHTTRPMREGEIQGKNYYFVNPSWFSQVEMIEKTTYSGYNYGTSVDEVTCKLAENNKVFIIADSHGVSQFKEKYGDIIKVIYVYLSPWDIEQRMIQRGDNPQKIQERIDHAIETKEFENIIYSDFCIINQNLDESIKQLKTIINLK